MVSGTISAAIIATTVAISIRNYLAWQPENNNRFLQKIYYLSETRLTLTPSFFTPQTDLSSLLTTYNFDKINIAFSKYSGYIVPTYEQTRYM